MILSKYSTTVQKIALSLNALQLGYLALSYFHSTMDNSFPVLESLFKPEFAQICTTSGCWQSIVPFLGSTYLSIALISLLALFFRAGRELKLMLIGLAGVHLVMATVRLTLVPAEFYIEGAALDTSLMQYLIGSLLLATVFLPINNDQEAA